MKAVMMSIRPEWCEKILNGEKTIEVRKSMPNIDAPFKCYVYCTGGKTIVRHWNGSIRFDRRRDAGCGRSAILNRNVIAEFTCNNISRIDFYDLCREKDLAYQIEGTCLSIEQIRDYAGWNESVKPWGSNDLYLWSIADTKCYLSPLPVKFFPKPYKSIEKYHQYLKRAPQSWCYVEAIV